MNNKELEITKNMNPHLLHSTDNIPKKISVKNKKIRKIRKAIKNEYSQKTLDQFEQLVKTKRKKISKKSGQGGYEQDELSLNEIVEFLSPVLDENGEKISIGTDEHGKEHFKLVNLKNTDDAVGEDLEKVGGAFDNKNDRGLVWFLELFRVMEYKDAVFNNEHEGLIVLIDIKSNIESFVELRNDRDALGFESVIDDVIEYWSKFLKNGHTHFVIIGKNRFLLAIPKIYEDAVQSGKLEIYNEEFVVLVKVWKKLVTSDFKSILYSNEKGNLIDNFIQLLIGNPGPYTDFVYDKSKEPFNMDVLLKLFNSEELVKYEDRQLIADLLTIINGEYTNHKSFLKKAFRERKEVTPKDRKLVDSWFKLIHYWLIDREGKKHTLYPIGQTWKMLMMQLLKEITNDGFKLNSDNHQTYTDIMSVAFEVRTELNATQKYYAYGTRQNPLSFADLMSGYKGTSATWRSDLKPFNAGHTISAKKLVKGKTQHELLNELFVKEVKERLKQKKIVIVNQKRTATKGDKDKIIALDTKNGLVYVRVNVEVIDPRTEKRIRFSEENPNARIWKKYGKEGSDYAWIPLSEINTSEHWVEHIISFKSDPEQYDIMTMEISSAEVNKWRQDKEIVDSDKVLQDIRERRG
mgnify:CR=1 FL=1